MKKLGFGFLVLLVVAVSSGLSADEYNCGRIKDNWPPALPKATGTTCKTGVTATSPQDAFNKCTTESGASNCCVENAVHKNIKGLAIIKGTEITHIPCPSP